MSELIGTGHVVISLDEYNNLKADSEKLEQLETDYSEHFSYRKMSEDEKGNVYINVMADIDIFSPGIEQMRAAAKDDLLGFPYGGRKIFVNELIIERTEVIKDFVFSENIGEGADHE